ncbi:hypothetical protein H2201_005127 [Coniosporium apollinis]|uniref:Uncharacterized protein n=1 Tax=Coniosporium apollinis TaxID=61459 RepID=A0ABQ9NQQ3_9PEZI|nr:hypothetical protein H2201_005127 [Coniosporium apollinis]
MSTPDTAVLGADPYIIELLLRAAFKAATPRKRSMAMRIYTKYMTIFKKKPTLISALESAAEKLSRTQSQPRGSTHLPADAYDLDKFMDLSTEAFNRIMSYVFIEATGIHRVQHLTILSVSHRIDHTFYVPLPQLPHLTNLLIGESPNLSQLVQAGGTLSLSSFCNSLVNFLPDPLSLVRYVRIAIDLLSFRIHLWIRHPAIINAMSPADRQVTHPRLEPHASGEEVMAWLEPHLTPRRAEYHLSIIQEIPFTNLRLLEVDFSSLTPDPDLCVNMAVTRWIGMYFDSIDINDMAKTVRIIHPDKGWAGMVQDTIDDGWEPWYGNL